MPTAPPGTRGSEGCQVVALEPGRSLTFTWSFPPTLPRLRAARTVVSASFSPGPRETTDVVLTQRGWRQGPDWDAGRIYFGKAWSLVLERLRRRFAEGPIDWSKL